MDELPPGVEYTQTCSCSVASDGVETVTYSTTVRRTNTAAAAAFQPERSATVLEDYDDAHQGDTKGDDDDNASTPRIQEI